MTEPSLILLMTGENRWNLSVVPARLIRGFDAAVADMEVGQGGRCSSDAGRGLRYAGSKCCPLLLRSRSFQAPKIFR